MFTVVVILQVDGTTSGVIHYCWLVSLCVQTMLELAKLQLVTGDLQSCQYLCDMIMKNELHKDVATVVRCT